VAAESVFERKGLLVPDLEKGSEWQRTAGKGADEDISGLAAGKDVLVGRGETEDGALVLLESMEEKRGRVWGIAHGSGREREARQGHGRMTQPDACMMPSSASASPPALRPPKRRLPQGTFAPPLQVHP
jgi:hypothetical protein